MPQGHADIPSEATVLIVAKSQKPPGGHSQRVIPGTAPDWPLGLGRESTPRVIEIKSENPEIERGRETRFQVPRPASVSEGHSSSVWVSVAEGEAAC